MSHVPARIEMRNGMQTLVCEVVGTLNPDERIHAEVQLVGGVASSFRVARYRMPDWEYLSRQIGDKP